jgi:hypothetical protein
VASSTLTRAESVVADAMRAGPIRYGHAGSDQ